MLRPVGILATKRATNLALALVGLPKKNPPNPGEVPLEIPAVYAILKT